MQSSALESVRSTLGTEQAKTDVVGATQNLREREQMLEMLVAAEQAVIDDDMEQLNYLLEGIKDAFPRTSSSSARTAACLRRMTTQSIRSCSRLQTAPRRAKIKMSIINKEK